MTRMDGGLGRSLSGAAWSSLFRAVGVGLGAAERLGLRDRTLDADALLEEASRATGLDDFGPADFLEPFRVLIDAYGTEAELTPLGRMATRADTLRLLTNRLRVVEDRKRNPEIAGESIGAPWVITGLPRTGTTLLFNLLALDPDNRTPLTWEVMHPSPPPGRRDRDDGRAAACDRALRWFGRMAPDYRKIHPVGAYLPQECIAITSQAFASVRFHRTHYVPSYREWLDGADLGPAYRWHHAFLQHLSWGVDAVRWVLKTPAHVFGLGPLLSVYPDARVIQTHRDPVKALASNASQTVVLRRAFSNRSPEGAIDDTMRRWSRALEEMMDRRDREEFADGVDLYHGDLVRDPVAGVHAVYERFGVDLDGDTEARMRRYVAEHPREEHGAHRYRPEDFGIDPPRHGALFARYRERFGV